MADIEDQLEYERDKYKERAKSELQITTDIILWHFVRDQRDEQLSLPLQAIYWIVTVDYRFLIFDRYKTSKTVEPPVCMLPAQFIQVLRFFVPRSTQFERMMLGTMRFPLVTRGFDTKAEQITLRILAQLARFEGISDLSIETIHRVLTDDTLRTRLISEPRLPEADEVKAVESSLARQLAEYQNSVANKEKDVEKLRARVGELVIQQESEVSEKQKLKDQLSELNERLTRQERERARNKAIRNYLILCSALVVPYPIVLAVVWQYLLVNLRYAWLAYLIAGLLTLSATALVIRILVLQGKKDEFIAGAQLFSRFSGKLHTTALISSAISVTWLILSALLVEAIKRFIFP